MKRPLFSVVFIALALGLASCGDPAPTGENGAKSQAKTEAVKTTKTPVKKIELDNKIKSKIGRQQNACIGSVNAIPGDTPVSDRIEERERVNYYMSVADRVGLAAVDSGLRAKRWDITQKPQPTVTMGMTLGDTSFDCDYRQIEGAQDWTLISAKRNGNEVYNRDAHTAIKAQNAKAYVATWRERDYQNASYKFYEKLYEGYNANASKAPSLRISCNPDYMQVLYIRENISRAETDYPFTFVTEDGPQDRLVDLNSRGSLSLQSEKAADGSSTQLGVLGFLKLMVKTKAIKVDGAEFKMDDLSQVPCLFLEAQTEE